MVQVMIRYLGFSSLILCVTTVCADQAAKQKIISIESDVQDFEATTIIEQFNQRFGIAKDKQKKEKQTNTDKEESIELQVEED